MRKPDLNTPGIVSGKLKPFLALKQLYSVISPSKVIRFLETKLGIKYFHSLTKKTGLTIHFQFFFDAGILRNISMSGKQCAMTIAASPWQQEP